MYLSMPVGVCDCGAVYTFDVTGHNLGAAMSEALVFACNGDWDLAWDLLPEDDYLSAQLERYDYPSHLIVKSRAYQGRNVTGVLYFIRLLDVVEVTEDAFRRKIEKKPVNRVIRTEIENNKGFITKEEVERLVSVYDIKGIIEASHKGKKIIPYLQRLLYSTDDLTRFRAADAMGKAAAVLEEYYPGSVKNLLQKLFASITDSAASAWGAIDAIGFILANMPRLYAIYSIQLYPFISDKSLLPHTLRALSLITGAAPESFNRIRSSLLTFLTEKDPEILAHAIMIMRNLRCIEALSDIMALKNDMREISVYEEGYFNKMTIGEIADLAIISINAPT